MIKRIFTNVSLIPEKKIEFYDEEFKYLKILRTVKGEKVEVFGVENYGFGIITEISKNNCFIKILSVENYCVKNPYLTIVQAYPEFNKPENIVRHLTELNIDKIIFVKSEKSKNIDSKKKFKFEKIIREAVRQCKRYSLPKIIFNNLTDIIKSEGKHIVLEPSVENSGIDIMEKIKIWKEEAQLNIYVGPESGWHEKELELFKTSHFEEIKISDNILRTETASVASAVLIGLTKF